MMRHTRLLAITAIFGLFSSVLHGQVPQFINYQGRITAANVNFDGTGRFKFALVNAAGTTSFWTNDGTHLDGTEPTTAVSIPVAKGLYSVLLGDGSVTNMTPIPLTVFANPDVRLRIWFNDGTHGSQQLGPDQRLGAVPYALVAGTVPAGAITSDKLAPGAVGAVQLGTGTINGFVTCNVNDPAHTFVYLRGTNALSYVGTTTANGFPFQLNNVPPGTYILVAQTSGGKETSKQVSLAAGQTLSNVGISIADLQSDPSNCGSCGTICPSPANATSACANGACGIGSCNTGFDNCDGNASNGCETNVNTDVRNCGTCGAACAAVANGTPGCTGGVCGIASCGPGFSNCDNNAANGCETNTTNSVSNCGTCGRVCALANATASCTNSACTVASCTPGFANCDGNPANGCEVNTSTDRNNCGQCGSVCPVPANGIAACSAGACGIASCNAGFGNCDGNTANGCETNTTNSPTNCGQCGVACPSRANAVPTCTSSTCGFNCNPGFANCNGSATDGCETSLTTVSNCGACGRACAVNQACVSGVCQ